MTLKADPSQAGFGDMKPLLRRVVSVLGNNQTAALLGVSKSQTSRWLSGQPISRVSSRRIADLEFVLRKAFEILHDDEVGPWLTYPQPLLGGARPIDVLLLQGTAPVIRALEGTVQGVFA